MIRASPLRAIRLMVSVTVLAASCGFSQSSTKLNVLGSPVDRATAVRLYFSPGDYRHPPLLLCVVASDDPRMNTAPMLQQGRTAYISATDMQHFLQGLKRMGPSWKESKKRVQFGNDGRWLPNDAMVIVAVAQRGTAEARVDPAAICKKLAPLDSALSTPRARWEFQEFRTQYKCVVPGSNREAYLDHDWLR